MGEELSGEHQGEPDVVGQRRQHGAVVDEALRREARPRGRGGEQRGQRRRVGGAAAVAEGEEPAASTEPIGHRPGRAVDLASEAVGGGGPELGIDPHLGGDRGAQVGQQRVELRAVRLDPRLHERVQEIGHRSPTFAMAEPACTRTRSSRTSGATSVASTRSTSPRRAHIGLEAVGRRPDHLAQVALVAAGDADRLVVCGLDQQSRMLEAHVGQLPEHVVPQHESAVERRRAVRVIHPDEHVRPGLRRLRASRDPQGGDAPGRGSLYEVGHHRIVGGAHRDHHVAGPGHRSHRGHGVGSVDRDGRDGARADDDRVHELDCDVTGVFGPPGREAPHGRARRQASSQDQRRRRQHLVGTQLGTDHLSLQTPLRGSPGEGRPEAQTVLVDVDQRVAATLEQSDAGSSSDMELRSDVATRRPRSWAPGATLEESP